MLKPKYYIRTSILFFLLLADVAYGQQESTYQQQIKQIGEKISELGKALSSKQTQRSSEQEKLQKTQSDIKKLQKKISQNQKNVAQQENRINKIQKQIDNYSSYKQQHTEQLSELLNSAYRISRTNYLKLLLNQENPYAIGRLNNYYRYFSQAQSEKIADIKMQLSSLDELKTSYQQEQEKLASSKQQLQKQKRKLQKKQNEKKKLLAKLDSSIDQTSKQIAKLEEDRKRLNNLLGSFSSKKAKPQRYIVTSGNFADQKGRLPLPVAGLLKQKFGVYITANGLRSDGVFFQTNNNKPVRSVYRGKVLFADWFKGYGLMIIVDHGNNYMSLYGHNNKLYKKIGDIVESNEVISESGTTGGLNTAGLYFEIRDNGNPVNPQLWCTGNG